MKRLLKVLCISLVIVGFVLLVWGLSSLHDYFREKKFNEGFGDMAISSEELGIIRDDVLTGIEETSSKTTASSSKLSLYTPLTIDEKVEYKPIIDYRDLLKNMESNYGKKWTFTGTVVDSEITNHPSDDFEPYIAQNLIVMDSDKNLYVVDWLFSYDDGLDLKVYEGDEIVVYGFDGTKDYVSLNIPYIAAKEVLIVG